jgi:hypothetical protein
MLSSPKGQPRLAFYLLSCPLSSPLAWMPQCSLRLLGLSVKRSWLLGMVAVEAELPFQLPSSSFLEASSADSL